MPLLLCKTLLTGQIINLMERNSHSLLRPAGAVAILMGQNVKAHFVHVFSKSPGNSAFPTPTVTSGKLGKCKWYLQEIAKDEVLQNLSHLLWEHSLFYSSKLQRKSMNSSTALANLFGKLFWWKYRKKRASIRRSPGSLRCAVNAKQSCENLFSAYEKLVMWSKS